MKVAVTDADLGSWAWTRNPLGETTALRDAKGQVIQFDYDALGRVTKRTAPDGTANWIWGSTASKKNIGRLASRSGPGYSEAFTYDSIGRPASQTIVSDSSYRFDYTYNALGLLDTITYPAAGAGTPFRIRHDYDDGRVSRIGNADAPGEYFWRQNAQDAAGHALDETLRRIDARHQRLFPGRTATWSIASLALAAARRVQDLAYAWDAARQPRIAARPGPGTARGIPLRRAGPAHGIAQERRRSTSSSTTTRSATSGASPTSAATRQPASPITRRASMRSSRSAAQAYEYDANGNMTSRGGAAIAWSSDDRPISIAQANGNSSQFSYGPDGNRWKQVAKNGGTTETTLYASGLFEKTTRGGVTTWRHYVLTPGGVAVQLR